jgi:hypothetical protein
MTVSGASAAGAYLASQPAQSISQHKRHRPISEVEMQGANAAGASGPTGNTGRKVDITA